MGLSLKKPEGVPGAAWPAIVIGLFVSFGGVLFGYDTGTISGILAMPYWINEFKTQESGITASEDSLIVSILSAGTVIGALLAAPTCDWMGRRIGLMFSCAIVFNLGVILQVASTGQPLLIAGRFFAGLGVGLLSAMVPLYQSETAPKWIRGTIVGAYQLAITIGLFLAACVNYATGQRNDSGSYRIPLAVQFLWSLIIVVGLLFLPETPRFLIKQSKHEKAAQSLSKLRRLDPDHPAIIEELAEIRANHEYELRLGKASYADCFKGSIGVRLATGCFLQGLQQLSGINFIMYYGTQYFENAGFAAGGFTIQVILNVINVVTTLPGLYLVEKMGRRGLLLYGGIGMTISQFIVAIVGTVSGTDNIEAQRTAIAFTCFYIAFFASSWGPVAWVVTGEIFPLKVRAKCLSMTTATNWLLNFGIAYATPYLVDEEYANMQSKVFFIWGSCCFICIAFVWSMIYETKGLSLEEVDELYARVNRAWKSKGFVPEISFMDADDAKRNGRTFSLTDMADEAQRKKSVTHVEVDAESKAVA